MRQIKFRGQCQQSKEFVYGDLMHGVAHKSGNAYILPMVKNLAYIKHCDPLDGVQVDPDTVGQHTGLKDKNGKEIYEGDILSDSYPVDSDDLSKGSLYSYIPVVWCDEKLMWCVDVSFAKDGSYLTSLVGYFGEFLEVKGNIYENPELLTP